MKKFLLCLFTVFLLTCPALADTPEYAEGEVLVVLDAPEAYAYSGMGAFSTNAYSQSVSSQAQTFADNYELEALNTYSEIAETSGKSIIHLRSEYKSAEELIEELSSDPEVVSVSLNYIRRVDKVPNDPGYPQLWGMDIIKMPLVWDKFTGSKNVCVAVLDSGIDHNHPDLFANLSKDSYGNFGRRFEAGRQTGDPMDTHGHGTHVAGTIGAVGNNGIGVAGVNWIVKMIAVNVLPNGSGYDSDIIDGMNYVVAENKKGLGVKVANMSFGGWNYPLADNSPAGTALKAMSDAGIICTIAAGNDYQNLGNPVSRPNSTFYFPGHRFYPACFKFENTITVGAIDWNDSISVYDLSIFSGSNYGREWVDIAAPGSAILSTIPNNSYATFNGTSMAAPHVAGAAAILFAAFPNESASQIKTRLLEYARRVGVGSLWKSGILDVWGALGWPDITSTSLPEGAVSNEYNATLGAIGMYKITWSITSGNLPNGLSLSSSGTISGTPTVAGTFSFTVKATNQVGSTTKNFSISVISKPTMPTITTSFLPSGIVGENYYQYISGSGTHHVSWKIKNGDSLPPGLNLDPNTGRIYGTPVRAGTYTFNIIKSNSAGSATKEFSITIYNNITSPRIMPPYPFLSLPEGAVAIAYRQQLITEGFNPFLWKITAGSLPSGLTMDQYTGFIYGVPTKAGTYSFTVRAEEVGLFATGTFSIVINVAPPRIMVTSLPRGNVGIEYKQILTTSGSTTISWTLSEGRLPPGLKLTTTNGLISGTPTTTGEFKFKIKATNTAGSTTQNYSIIIYHKPTVPVITTTSLAAGAVGGNYNQYLRASGSAPITRWISSGALPPGLSLSSDGWITGSPTTKGTYNFNVKATNAAGSVTKVFTIIINAAGAPSVTLSSSSLPDGFPNKAYNQKIDVNGITPITWSIVSGSLPRGLSLNTSTGVISGTPTVEGTYKFTLKATNSIASVTIDLIIVIAIPPTISMNNLWNGTIDSPYSQTLYATGTTPITWSLASGSLPPDLILDPDGMIFGIPATLGTFNYTIKATNSAGSDTKAISIYIMEPTPPGKPPVIISATIPPGAIGTPYNSTLSASGTTPIQWSLSGSVPPGLSININTGVISGTPTTMGTFSFTVRATNIYGYDTKTLNVSINGLAPTITTSSLPTGNVGVAYSQILSASGTAPITWSISSGSLPNGLSLNGSSGTISGTPTTGGTFSFSVRAQNTAGSVARSLSIVISGAALPVITTSSLPGGAVGTSYNQTLSASGTAPISWSITSGSLPGGLSLNSSTGTISGTPTTGGTFSFTVKAQNTAGNVTKTLSIVISSAALPVITTSSLPGGTKGASYSQKLSATGTTPISWSISSGSLPSGLSLNSSTATISGAPSATGTFSFTVKAQNTAGSATKTLSIVVSAALPPLIITASLPGGTVGASYNQILLASGTAPINWSLYVGSLPPGLILDWGAGIITGKPIMAGTYNFTIKAENAGGSTIKALSVKVVGGVGTSLPSGFVGKFYSSYVPGIPLPILLSGSLPPGLTFNANTGLISGTPVIAGTFNFTVRSQNIATSPMIQMNISIINMLAGAISTAEDDNATQLDEEINVNVSDESEAIEAIEAKEVSEISEVSKNEESKNEENKGCNAAAGYGYLSFALFGVMPFVNRKRH